jgi:hypothetical protein
MKPLRLENPWLLNLENCTYTSGPAVRCRIDTINNTVTACDTNCENAKLKFDSSLGYFQYATGNTTQFKRVVSIFEDPLSGEAKVAVAVSWGTSLFLTSNNDATNVDLSNGSPSSTGNSLCCPVQYV